LELDSEIEEEHRTMPITITDVNLDVSREPLTRPFGFKGAYFTEKWLCHVELQNESEKRGTGLGGLAVLWSDGAVFHAHTEVGGNVMMVAMLERALALARGMPFETPLDLLDSVVEPVYEYGQAITRNADLRKTFALNALVALDNAAWSLYAHELGTTDFDALIPDVYRPALSQRHTDVAIVPLISYGVSLEEVGELAESGCFVLKIKIGAAGEPDEMLAKDMERISEIHAVLRDVTTPHTEDGKVRYYLDANGRYPSPDLMKRLLDHARDAGMMEQIMILEEPFPETEPFSVGDLGVRVAADESLHDTSDVDEKAKLGYGALALKPAGKTLSMTLRMAAEARRRDIPCFVADSACVPALVEWNKNVAARLAPLPGLKTGLQESNGAQHYARWRELIDAHPCAGAGWIEAGGGVFSLDDDFYARSGGIFAQL